MMKKLILPFSALTLAFVANSCKTDFETIAPYKEMVSVYGLIEHQNNTNYIRINRVFLTDGNAYTAAQIEDSVNFKAGELAVSLEKYRDGNLNNTFNLSETTVTLPSGDFNTNQRLWVCNNQLASYGTGGSDLGHSVNYKLKIHNNTTGKDFTASTNMIENFTYPLGGIIYLSSIDMTNPTYPRTIKWYNPINAVTNGLTIRFHYKEYATSDTSQWTDKYVDWVFNNFNISDPTQVNNEVKYEFYGIDFYNFLKSRIPEDPNIYGRKAGVVECITTAIGNELQVYNDVNAPSNTIVQEKPIYSNISDGVGVFSSRTSKSTNLNLSITSLDKLAGKLPTYAGSPTCGLKFFDSNNVLGPGCQ